MQSVSAEFTTHSQAAIQKPVAKLEVQWDGGSWVDESANLASHKGTLRYNAGGPDLTPSGTTDSMEITLHNTGFRYSPLATTGDSSIRVYISGDAGFHGIAFRLEQGYTLSTGNTYVRIFTGIIYAWQEDSAAKTIKLFGRDMGYKYLQRRASTALVTNVRTDRWIEYLARNFLLEATQGATIGDVSNLGVLIGGTRMRGIGVGTSTGPGVMVLDKSNFYVEYAWLDDESVLEEIYAAAAAEGGTIYFDHTGGLRFETWGHWLRSPHNASVWTFSASRMANLTPMQTADSLATEVVVEWSPRRPGMGGVLFEIGAGEYREIRPGASVTFDVRLPQPAVAIFDPRPEDDYWLQSSGGLNMNASCTLTIITYAQRARVTITNNHTTLAAILSRMQLRGIPLEGQSSQEYSKALASPPLAYERTRSVRGNPYLQTHAQAEFLANFLSDRHAQIVDRWTLRDVPGVPQLQLGDRVTFSDARIVGSTREGFVTGIDWTFDDAAGYYQTITILDAAGLWPSATYYAIGSTALGSGSAWY